MKPEVLLRAARCWERAGHFAPAAERYARAEDWADAGRCWAQAGRPVNAAEAYARAGEPIGEARQWLASPWPERSRQPYRQALEMGLSTAAEVEALLGLGEIELASERAFAVVSQNGRSVEALRSLARITAARGRPDLAARAWGQAIAGSPATAREVFEDWGRAASWNRSLGWGRPQEGVFGWPRRGFRHVNLELVWEEKIGSTMYGNRGLAWSADGRRFAAAKCHGALSIGSLIGREVRCQSVEVEARSVAFIPGSDSALVGCKGGRVVQVNTSGAAEDIEELRMPDDVYGVMFSSRHALALASRNSRDGGSLLKTWPYGWKDPEAAGREEFAPTNDSNTNPACAWSPDGHTLAWCPGPWSRNTMPNDLYLFSDSGRRCVSTTHENVINGIAFSPDGRQLFTASNDRTLVIRDAHTGEAVAPPWRCPQRLYTVVFHPHAALMAAGGAEGSTGSFELPGRLYIFQLPQDAASRLEVIQEKITETAVCSLAFSPDGEYLLMSTDEQVTIFRVNLT